MPARAVGGLSTPYSAAMSTQQDRADHFLQLHHADEPLLVPNPWDPGSAVAFAALGFEALATTSSGQAGTLGRTDGEVVLEEVLAHAAVMAAATDLPVSADFENGFADEPEAVAANVADAVDTGLSGLSVEDWSADGGIYELGLAADRVAAAAVAAHDGPARIVLTARAENHLRGVDDLGDTIARLEAYASAGADVLYAPGLVDIADIAEVVDAVDRPVNVLFRPQGPNVAELAELGVSRVSVGGALAYVALGAAIDAAREFLEEGTYGWADAATVGGRAARAFR
jgi:2-methylisocitrate lyase-like PEP mutase family enzyme